MRSTRLATKLTCCSVTPRSEERLDSLSADASVPPHEHIYEEAKLTLSQQDVDTALTLFGICQGYRNTAIYTEQCRLFNSLCRQGVVHRAQTGSLRVLLSSVLCEPTDSAVIGKYAELLRDTGFTSEALARLTLWEARRLFRVVSFPCGFRALLEAHFRANTSLLLRCAFDLVCMIRKCAAPCLSALARSRRLPANEDAEEDGDSSDDDDSGDADEDDSTAE